LIDWFDWLKPGGKLVIETPDFKRCARSFAIRRNPAKQALLLRHVFGSHEASWAVHYDGWYRGKFNLVLRELGYTGLSFKRTGWRGTFNLTVTAFKPENGPSRTDRVAAAERLLALSLVDRSAEERLLAVWRSQLSAGTPDSEWARSAPSGRRSP
jgi:hypothetical protein